MSKNHPLLKCKPSFCYIAPTSMLEHTTASQTHLLLAHLIDRDETYSNFYRDLDDSHFKIMDCSSYELLEPYSPDKLIELGRKVRAHVLVLPDYPFEDCQKTIDAADQYAQKFKDAGFGTFFVPQSKTGNLSDYLKGFEYANNNPLIDVIGVSILGCPNALPGINPAFSRVVLMQILKERNLINPEKHYHFLGLNSSPKLEVPSLIAMGVMNTMDSSNPIWTAMLGTEYSHNTDSFSATVKPKMAVNFDAPKVKDVATINRIKHNIALTQSLFTGDNTQEVWYAQE